MKVKVRLVQRFQAASKAQFLTLERQFALLERENPAFPKGKRYLPYSGREAGNTLIWECEFESLEAANQALAFLEQDTSHEELAQQQLPYFQDAYTEIYRLLED
ncbi:hypothetical protein [Paenibacillus sp. BC26]|uniref:hypothetical protein n=1 Tax=Paenibacillus sp. BC26 TaxID=1881032 RepID=UPI0008EEF644|nr:hypothetical protein [Paenibacillus sp. BC26]SFS69046.1 hypothetical protein SAMN05428962_2298 [Paenibacillus sp. BC26]